MIDVTFDPERKLVRAVMGGLLTTGDVALLVPRANGSSSDGPILRRVPPARGDPRRRGAELGCRGRVPKSHPAFEAEGQRVENAHYFEHTLSARFGHNHKLQ